MRKIRHLRKGRLCALATAAALVAAMAAPESGMRAGEPVSGADTAFQRYIATHEAYAADTCSLSIFGKRAVGEGYNVGYELPFLESDWREFPVPDTADIRNYSSSPGKVMAPMQSAGAYVRRRSFCVAFLAAWYSDALSRTKPEIFMENNVIAYIIATFDYDGHLIDHADVGKEGNAYFTRMQGRTDKLRFTAESGAMPDQMEYTIKGLDTINFRVVRTAYSIDSRGRIHAKQMGGAWTERRPRPFYVDLHEFDYIDE